VRAAVCSVPEPGCAVVAAGRRELPSDAGLPVLLTACSPDRTPRTPLRGTAVRIFDHHLVLTEVEGLHVGDVVGSASPIHARHSIAGPDSPSSGRTANRPLSGAPSSGDTPAIVGSTVPLANPAACATVAGDSPTSRQIAPVSLAHPDAVRRGCDTAAHTADPTLARDHAIRSDAWPLASRGADRIA